MCVQTLFETGCKWEISRPGGRYMVQRPFYSGYISGHCFSWHVVSSPDGIIQHVFGPLPGCMNDLNVLDASELLQFMEDRPGKC